MSYKLLIVCLLAFPAGAATLRPYTPGGSPCAGACGYEWARDRFQVPEGVPERMVIPAGSIVIQMSYAKDGVPYTFSESAILMDDEPGQGYFFEADGQTYMMVQLDACQNWAVMLPPAQGLSYAPDAPLVPTPTGHAPSGGGGGGGCWGCGGGTEPPPPPPPPPCCEPPPAVPLLPPLWALFSALALLTCLKRIANRR